MGCTGTVSGLSIGFGDKCVFIPLLPNNGLILEPCSQIITNEGAEGVMTPLSLPIFGTYDEYGLLENIRHDDNTACLEGFFGISIEEIVGQISCNSSRKTVTCPNPKKQKILRSLFAMYELEKIYRELIEFDLKEHSKLSSHLTESNLLSLGFELNRFDEKIKGGYDWIYRFPGVDDYEIQSNERYGHIVKVIDQKENPELNVYDIKDLAEKWHKLTGIKLNISGLEKTSVYDPEYEEMRRRINRNDYMEHPDLVKKKKRLASLGRFMRTRDYGKKDRDISSNKQLFYNILITSELEVMSVFSHFKHWPYFGDLYLLPIMDGKLKKEISEFLHFRMVTHSCNRFFFPANIGEQCGNPQASKALLKASLEIVNQEIGEREKEDDDVGDE